MYQYEIAILYHPDLEVDITKAEARVKKIIDENDGKITTTDNWGKRKLAYPIKHSEYAVYVFYVVQLPPQNVARIERALNITDEVLRFLITRPDLKAAAKSEAEKAKKAKQAAQRDDSEDKEKGDDED
jgi:small subunit ribosomal protein S6